MGGLFAYFLISNSSPSGMYFGGMDLGTVWKYAKRAVYIYFLTHFREMWVREYKCITFKEIIHNKRLAEMF